MADLYIAIANITFFFALLGAYLLRSAIVGRRRHARTESDGGSLFLNKRTMEMVYWILEPIIDFLAALHITPNMVTLFSLVPAAGAGVALGFGWFGLASALAVMATFCDILDGLLARKTGVSSGGGEVIDAAVDRYGEMFFFGGLVYYYRSHDQVLFIVLAAIVGSFMVSYATAKAEAMGVAAPRGAMRRGERAAYLIFGSAFTPVAKAVFANSPSLAVHELPIILALTIVAVVSNISVLQRLSAVIDALRAKEKASAEAAPETPEPMGSKPDPSAGQV
ncbi:MAG TPA: CDP-alcohol phosphatidyltransferase family protein [Polyangia bacterium]|nr:CDP-alcohol phosphatidyltransferase family protein [Polyangia bacterium]